MIQEIKDHVSRHKTAYLIGSYVVVAGITYVIVRERYAGFLRSPDTAASISETVFVRPLSFFSKQQIVTVIEREGRGHPGYIVRCIETGKEWISQAKAAEAVGTSAQNMSSHLNGRFPDVYGFHFERIAV